MVTVHLFEAGWPIESIERARLLTSELAGTNAVTHAHGNDYSVVITLIDDVLHCDVNDDDVVEPSVQDPSTDAAGGRGMRLVDTLADEWGVEPTATGKVVWFELARRPIAAHP